MVSESSAQPGSAVVQKTSSVSKTEVNSEHFVQLVRPNPIVVSILGIVAAVGIAVVLYRIYFGIGTTALGSVTPWGLWVALYILFIGLSAGSFLLSTLIFVFKMKSLEPVARLAILQAFICLVTGIAFISLDLGKISRFWHPLVYPQFRSSVLAYEIWLYGGYIAMLLVELWLLMRMDLAHLAIRHQSRLYALLSFGHRLPANSEEDRRIRSTTSRMLMTLGMIGIPLAIGVHGGTGAIFAVVKARPFWHTAIFPLVFIVSALASGGGLLLFLKAYLLPDVKVDRQLLPVLARLTGAFLVFDLFLLALELLVGFYGQIPEHLEVYHLMLYGPHWYVFWVLQTGIGAILPLAMIFWPGEKSARTYGLAGGLIVLGIVGVRLNIVIPALSVPVLPGFERALNSIRFTANYFPNWVEWGSSAGVIGLMALAGYLMSRYLPMIERQSHDQ
jgi:Ni/Fe-hydrogenase subunit HybB-like protein